MTWNVPNVRRTIREEGTEQWCAIEPKPLELPSDGEAIELRVRVLRHHRLWVGKRGRRHRVHAVEHRTRLAQNCLCLREQSLSIVRARELRSAHSCRFDPEHV